MRRSLVSRPGFSCRVTTHSTMRPTAGHEIPSSRLSVVRSVTCARYAVSSSSGAVNALFPTAHHTRNPHRRAGYRRRRRIAAERATRRGRDEPPATTPESPGDRTLAP